MLKRLPIVICIPVPNKFSSNWQFSPELFPCIVVVRELILQNLSLPNRSVESSGYRLNANCKETSI